ncbi:MAG: SLBB domain-containing protein [Bacillota bacterium]
MNSTLRIMTFLTLLFSSFVFAQQGNIKIGADVDRYRQNQGGFYDYSDPEAVNIKVSVWGFVRFPGYYLVPSYTNPRELLSLAGGPTDAAHLDDLRIYRVMEDSTQKLLKFSYNDLLWEENLSTTKEKTPSLNVGDVLVVPGAPRLYFRDTLSLVLSVVSTVTTVVILILGLRK